MLSLLLSLLLLLFLWWAISNYAALGMVTLWWSGWTGMVVLPEATFGLKGHCWTGCLCWLLLLSLLFWRWFACMFGILITWANGAQSYYIVWQVIQYYLSRLCQWVTAISPEQLSHPNICWLHLMFWKCVLFNPSLWLVKSCMLALFCIIPCLFSLMRFVAGKVLIWRLCSIATFLFGTHVGSLPIGAAIAKFFQTWTSQFPRKQRWKILLISSLGQWWFTLWLFNIAMENGPFIDDFPIKTSIYEGLSMAMLNNQMIMMRI